MPSELDIYTGELTYKDIIFTFVFDKKELKLIPPKDSKHKVWLWFRKEIGKDAYTFGDPECMEDDFLTGRCNETGQKIIFFPGKSEVGYKNLVLRINIKAYIIQKFDRDCFDRMCFMSEEIDYIYPTTQALDTISFDQKGKINIETKDFLNTTSEPQHFQVDRKDISVYFGITRLSKNEAGKPPLELHSVMYFEFKPTQDFDFLLRLWFIARSFIQYLNYRNNINLFTVDIDAPYNDSLHECFAELLVIRKNSLNTEPEVLKRHRYIEYKFVEVAAGKILNDIAIGRIYLRHIPESYKIGRTIDAARFVMITAALEWTFNKNYSNGISISKKIEDAEKNAEKSIQDLIDHTNKKEEKKIYKHLKKQIRLDSLKSKIIQIGKDYGNIINIFGERLYALNDSHLDYNEMGDRLGQQRNNFAHGNLDKDFIGTSLNDVVFAEQIIYVMQLKEYGVDDLNIKQAINMLFGCSLKIIE